MAEGYMGWSPSVKERGEICLEKEEEREQEAEKRRGEKERKSSESKYVKGYLIVSTLYPRLR